MKLDWTETCFRVTLDKAFFFILILTAVRSRPCPGGEGGVFSRQTWPAITSSIILAIRLDCWIRWKEVVFNKLIDSPLFLRGEWIVTDRPRAAVRCLVLAWTVRSI